MAGNDGLRLDPESARAVVDRITEIADQTHARGKELAESMTTQSAGGDVAGTAAAALGSGLNEAGAARSRLFATRLRNRAAAAHRTISATVSQDEANEAALAQVLSDEGR